MTSKIDLTKRYSENPFVENMKIETKGRSLTLSPMGKDNTVLLNQATGEMQGTHITTYKKVDAEKFVKLFTQNIALTFDLNSPGIKVFNVLMFVVQEKAMGRDLVVLDKYTLEEFLSFQQKKLSLSPATFTRGIQALEEAKIIAKAVRKGSYYINPNFVFNGDRIAFTTVIEKQESVKKGKEIERFYESDEYKELEKNDAKKWDDDTPY